MAATAVPLFYNAISMTVDGQELLLVDAGVRENANVEIANRCGKDFTIMVEYSTPKNAKRNERFLQMAKCILLYNRREGTNWQREMATVAVRIPCAKAMMLDFFKSQRQKHVEAGANCQKQLKDIVDAILRYCA